MSFRRRSLANPVRIFPSRLADPSLQANGRWIAVNANTRRAFVLRGKDEVPELLAALTDGTHIHGDVLASLQPLGLIEWWNELRSEDEPHSYIDWYRLLNFNYPFVDYSASTALRRDSELMSAYSRLEAPPPTSTLRFGPLHKLPHGSVDLGTQPATSSEDFIAGVLRIVAGVKATVAATHGMQLRKTSPSGGARHPTEIEVIVAPGCDNGIEGSWWYLPEEHGLVRTSELNPVSRYLPEGALAFVIRSRVERAMWRYRDARSFRPLIIDAGHVLETLALTLGTAGWFTGWINYPAWSDPDDPFCEPQFGVLIATTKESRVSLSSITLSGQCSREEPLVTNPCISFVPLKCGLAAEIFYPTSRQLSLSTSQVHALTYCIPSTRGDRPSSLAHIRNLGIEDAELELLIESQALLPESIGLVAWKSASLWSRRGWFTSLLAHANATSFPVSNVVTRRAEWLPDDLSVALDRRHTCRQFTGLPLPDLAWSRIMQIIASLPAKVIISVLRAADSKMIGNWRLNGPSPLEKCGQPLTDQVIQSLAIGQSWTKGMAIIVWLFPCVSEKSWAESMLDLGRAAQKLALAVSSIDGVGVFQTPALVDTELAALHATASVLDGAYLVGIGHTTSKGELSRSQFLYRPSDILRNRDSVT